MAEALICLFLATVLVLVQGKPKSGKGGYEGNPSKAHEWGSFWRLGVQVG
jgi:hypothetical protein